MKQLASTFIFVAIISLSLSCLFLIFTRMPDHKAALFEQRASRYFYDSQDSTYHDEVARTEAAENVKKYFILALRNNPYDAALWIRLASVQKTLGNSAVDNDTLFDAVRIAKELRPDIRSNLDRILIQINENNTGSVNE